MKAIRYKAAGKYLRNTLFYTSNSDFIGAYHGCPDDAIYDPVMAAEEEALTVASHKQDFATAFGLSAADITAETVAWDGDPAHLPAEDETDAHERLPVAVSAAQAPEPTPAEKVAAALIASPSLDRATKDALLAAVGQVPEFSVIQTEGV